MQPINFQRISFDEANPSSVGAKRAMELYQMGLNQKKTMLANQLSQVQNQYAPQLARGNLKKLDLSNQTANAKLPYAGIGAAADAASKLAYAKLLGPQFVAKLLSNDSILANLPDDQKRSLLASITSSGTDNNGMPNIPSSSNISNPQLSQVLSNRNQQIQQDPQVGQQVQQQNEQNSPPSFAENVANYKGVVKEGEKLGEQRAKDISDLGKRIFTTQNQGATLDYISKSLNSPEFEKIRQVPLLGHQELSYYAKFGTPEQQRMIGSYYTATGDIIKNSARDFPGQFRKGEQSLLASMKPTPSDTVDTARGKVQALSFFNKMLHERSRLTAEFMSKEHMNQAEALERADKLIDGDKIRKSIESQMYPDPMVQLRNKKTGETITIPRSEAIKKYGVE